MFKVCLWHRVSTWYFSRPDPSLNQTSGVIRVIQNTVQTHRHTHPFKLGGIPNKEPPSAPFPPSSYQLKICRIHSSFHPLKHLSRQTHPQLGDGDRQSTKTAPSKPHLLLLRALGNHLPLNLAAPWLIHNSLEWGRMDPCRTLKAKLGKSLASTALVYWSACSVGENWLTSKKSDYPETTTLGRSLTWPGVEDAVEQDAQPALRCSSLRGGHVSNHAFRCPQLQPPSDGNHMKDPNKQKWPCRAHHPPDLWETRTNHCWNHHTLVCVSRCNG